MSPFGSWFWFWTNINIHQYTSNVVVTEVEGMCVPGWVVHCHWAQRAALGRCHALYSAASICCVVLSPAGCWKFEHIWQSAGKSQPWIVAFRTMFLDVHLWCPRGNLHQFATVKAKNVLENMAEPSSSWLKFTLTYTENRLHGGDEAEKSDAFGCVWKFGGPNRFSVDQHPLNAFETVRLA